MQNPFLSGLILAAIGFVLGGVVGSPYLFSLLGFLLGHTLVMGNKLTIIQDELARLRAAQQDPKQVPEQNSQAGLAPQVSNDDASIDQSEPAAAVEAATTEPDFKPNPARAPQPARAPKPPRVPQPPSAFNKAISGLFKWFTGGNVFMKVGIGLLFLGVGFLLNYAASAGLFTIEMRLAAIAIAAIAALVVGQRLLTRKRQYGLMLQGAAIGVLYLDIFGAYILYQLLPAGLAFGLLVAISAISAVLAVLQKAPALAFAGFAGGFLAPVLASSGSGNHVALFSYYLVLDAAILGIAWFQSWRSLNLLGFYFTFFIGAAWGLDGYQVDKYASTQPFLVIFFLFFVAMSVLYARRQPPELKGYVDASLLFATPVLAFSMQLVLMDPFPYGSAWSALAFGAFYLGLAGILWRQKKSEERLLVEVFLALGVLFTTLVIPFALGAADTAGAWALEGAGMIWIGIRQNRILARLLGIALQLASALFWLVHHPADGQQIFINSSYLAGAMIALAAFFTAKLYRTAPSTYESNLSTVFTGLFVLWWYGVGFREVMIFATEDAVPVWIVAYTLLSALVVTELATRWDWHIMRMTSLLAPIPCAMALLYLVLYLQNQPHVQLGWLVWPFAMAAYGWILWRTESHTNEVILSYSHVAWIALVLGLIQAEVVLGIVANGGIDEGWALAAMAAPGIIALQVIHRFSFWPVGRWLITYRGFIAGGVASLLSVFIVATFLSSGIAAPLPWLPLLNPLDLATLFVVFTVCLAWMDMSHLFPKFAQAQTRQLALLGFGVGIFVWLNVTLLRAIHHWKSVPYDLEQLLRDSFTQTSLSILWVSIGMLLVIVATRKASRAIWIVGAVVLAAVVLKLFVQDLANTGSLARIVSFLGVGGMLVVIGYFSPLPPKRQVDEGDAPKKEEEVEV